MTTVVVLLRGVNVGGRNRVPMADLRVALADAGFSRVETYIQSGNVVADHPSPDPEIAAALVRSVIAATLGLDIPSIGMGLDELRGAIAALPFPEEADPKRVHAIVLPHPPGADVLADVATREANARAKGSRDRVTVIGRVAYLHTPDGFGTSDLAKTLSSARSPLADGTARNWATMTTLLRMAEAAVTDP